MPEKIKILTVDDDPYLRDLLLETLTAIGYDAIGAESVDDAIQILNNPTHANIRLVITDIKMPGKSGLDLSETLAGSHPQLPVIFISGVFSRQIIETARTRPFIEKPFRIALLEQKIEEVLSLDIANDDFRKPVLVVDDDDTFRAMLIETLKLSGYTVVGAADGEGALRMLKSQDFATVITDIRMPGIDGIDLAGEIKNLRPTLPVILMTAYLSAEHEEQARDIADAFLLKPFKIEHITSLLSNLQKK